jgi:trimethylamine--corrinoid protein Co-methyltransferase
MRSNCTMQQPLQFRVFSESQLEELHSAALEILRRTGVDVLEEEARELLRTAGAKVDGSRVRIPPGLVEWALQTAPSQVVICNRNANPAMCLERRKSYYGTGSDTKNIVDPYTGEKRSPAKADIANVAKLCDYLPNIDFVMCMGIAHDVTGSISDLHHFEAMVNNTKKPIVSTAWNLDNLKDIVEMAEIVAGGPEALRYNPFIVLYLEPISPLQLALEAMEKLLYMASKGLPFVWTPGQVGGATSPVTLAGALAQGNAEALSGLLIAQLKREGTPVIYGGCALPMDMVTTLAAYGAPEFMLSVAAWADLAHYYRLPVWGYAGCSDSKVFDQQAALEGAMNTLMATLSGQNLVHDVGYIESGITTSFEQLVSSNEVIGMAKQIAKGIEISEETLALDVIDKVGPGGHFLGEDHTLRHFRGNWFPELINRDNCESWVEKGEKTLGQRANEKVREILETHAPEPLPEEVKGKLKAIIERAEKRVSKEAR